MAKNRFRDKPRPDYAPRRWDDAPVEPVRAPGPPPKKTSERLSGFVRASGLVRTIVTLTICGLFLHGLFTVFDIYDRNRVLDPSTRATLWLKLAVFLAVVVVVYQVMIRFRPLTKKLRGASAMALMPAILVAVFNLFGGAVLFGDNIALLVALNLILGLGGFMGYLLVYGWILGRKPPPPDPAEGRLRKKMGTEPLDHPEIGANRRKSPHHDVRLPD